MKDKKGESVDILNGVLRYFIERAEVTRLLRYVCVCVSGFLSNWWFLCTLIQIYLLRHSVWIHAT